MPAATGGQQTNWTYVAVGLAVVLLLVLVFVLMKKKTKTDKKTSGVESMSSGAAPKTYAVPDNGFFIVESGKNGIYLSTMDNADNPAGQRIAELHRKGLLVGSRVTVSAEGGAPIISADVISGEFRRSSIGLHLSPVGAKGLFLEKGELQAIRSPAAVSSRGEVARHSSGRNGGVFGLRDDTASARPARIYTGEVPAGTDVEFRYYGVDSQELSFNSPVGNSSANYALTSKQADTFAYGLPGVPLLGGAQQSSRTSGPSDRELQVSFGRGGYGGLPKSLYISV